MKSNEDSKTVYFSFTFDNVKNFETIKQIRNFSELGYNSQSDLLRDAVISFLDNGTNDIKEEIEKEKLQSIKNKNSLFDLTARKLDAKTRIAEYHADNLDVVGAKPSKKSKEAMKHYTHRNGFNEEVQRKYKINYFENDELCYKALCKICETLFESKDKQEVTDDVCWHIEEIHKQRAETVVSKN